MVCVDRNERQKMNRRVHIAVRGAVQGVGFRPFVYRLASELHLTGWVSNSPHGVIIEAEGTEESVRALIFRLEADKPVHAFITGMESTILAPRDYEDFRILQSQTDENPSAIVLPDIATCDECLAEIRDPENRRYRYAFTNCTHCGPRYSIIESLPYDRARTSMKRFTMCADCMQEYEDPSNRRFHAQPNACPRCGPQMELWDRHGFVCAREHAAMEAAVRLILDGQIVAIKGLGGFQLLTDARQDDAIRRLRHRKHREEKPFALMYPTLHAVETDAVLSDMERRLLRSPEAPIVLVKRRPESHVGSQVAPSNPYLGVMLPTTPLHHLLMERIEGPVIATSGNISDEPICIDEHEALNRLRDVADSFLVHNRPILRHVDDSIVRVVLDREMVLRRARGYAPLPLSVPVSSRPETILGVGAHLKNTVAVTSKHGVVMSQHIGDLETESAYHTFRKIISQLSALYRLRPTHVACDLHPDYLSTSYARRSLLPTIAVQHHYAHVLACMSENEVDPPCLGISWDGTGYGLDGTIWGGEFLTVTDASFDRTGHLRTFLLPGGDRAVREPRRSALGLLFEMYGESVAERPDMQKAFSPRELDVLIRAMVSKTAGIRTSSIGRLFDAVAFLTDIRHVVRFEGQAAMELEFATHGIESAERYPIDIQREDNRWVMNWQPMMDAVLYSISHREPAPIIATAFHNTLIHAAAEMARRIGIDNIVLTGGCFQNRYLLEKLIAVLREAGFYVFWHQRIPPNDGGIAIGQIVAALRTLQNESTHVPRRSR
jgi:hydrogenase maturation protein HypF